MFHRIGNSPLHPSGPTNGEGAITVEVKHTGADSFLSGVIKLVQEAQASKSRTQDIANRAAFWFTVIALSVSALTAFSWMFFTEQGVAFAAANGLLIRDRTAFEEARRTQAIVFDKTSTLTKGEVGITD